MKKTLMMQCILIGIMTMPSLAFAYGEGDLGYQIPLAAREFQLLINEARSEPSLALTDCPESICIEKACYDHALKPMYWNDNLFKVAQLHANMSSYADVFYNKREATRTKYESSHNSPCPLNPEIVKTFPKECDGKPECACKDGVFINKNVTTFFNRLTMFQPFGTVTIANKSSYGTGGGITWPWPTRNVSWRNIKSLEPYQASNDLGYFAFIHLLTEGGLASGTKGKCEASNGNGHRDYMIGDSTKDYTAEGAGVRCAFVEDRVECIFVHDNGYVVHQKTNVLTAGSHYQKVNTYPMWFKTHYYSDVDASKVMLSIGDQCIELSKTAGTNKNGVWGTKDPQGITECTTTYFFEAKDDNGNISRFPTRGSLVYMPTKYKEGGYCDGKTWEPESGKSCFGQLNCKANQHANGNQCEDDSLDNCGAHGYNCRTKVDFWADGTCKYGDCVISECTSDAYLYDGVCLANSLSNCGAHGYACKSKVKNWSSGICHEGVCVAKKCASGYHAEDGKCVANNASLSCKTGEHQYGDTCEANNTQNCGSHGFDCKKYSDGFAEGNCTNGACVPTSCIEGYKFDATKKSCVQVVACNIEQHPDGGKCVDNSVNACGSKDNDCTKQTGWGTGDCTGGKCVLKTCKTGFYKDGTSCKASDINHCGSTDCTKVDGWSAGDCKDDKCVASDCKDDYDLDNGTCKKKSSGGEDPSVNCDSSSQYEHDGTCHNFDTDNCGDYGKSCKDDISGWSAGTCTKGVCLVTSCTSGLHVESNACVENSTNCGENQHEYAGSCESNSLDNCGAHGHICKNSIDGWAEGECSTNGECIVTACNDNMTVRDKECVESDGTENAAPVDSCSGHPTDRSGSMPWIVMLGIAGLGWMRRRRLICK